MQQTNTHTGQRARFDHPSGCVVHRLARWPSRRGDGVAVRRQPGFTLIELLVCLSIIMLLVAMLSPALWRTKALGRSTQCKSRLRQIGAAFGLDPHAFPNAKTWPGMPYRLMSNPSDALFRCPEDTYDPPGPAVWELSYVTGESDGSRHIPFRADMRSPKGERCSAGRRGPGYFELVFEEQADKEAMFWSDRRVCKTSCCCSDNDGVFRIYDEFGRKPRRIVLYEYDCFVDNRAYVNGKPMFGYDAPLGIFVGDTRYLERWYTSYGMPASVNSPDIAPDAVLLVDYACPPDQEGFIAVNPPAYRHLGKANALHADQSVTSIAP